MNEETKYGAPASPDVVAYLRNELIKHLDAEVISTYSMAVNLADSIMAVLAANNCCIDPDTIDPDFRGYRQTMVIPIRDTETDSGKHFNKWNSR